MNFYEVWGETRKLEIRDSEFIGDFLSKSESSRGILINGMQDEIKYVCDFLESIHIDEFFENIVASEPDYCIDSTDIPCFSDFENGIVRVSELLEFNNEGLTFEELGYQLIQSKAEGARVKYGENHAKLAAMADLVEIVLRRPLKTIVKQTSLGHYLVRYSFFEKEDLIKKLLLRNKLIKLVIKEAINGKIRYSEIVKVADVSMATAIRRRPNVHTIVDYIMKGSNYEECLKNIDWKV